MFQVIALVNYLICFSGNLWLLRKGFMDDSASWKCCLELPGTSGSDVGSVNVEFLKGSQFGELRDGGIGDG
jgi:hypothetical protein